MLAQDPGISLSDQGHRRSEVQRRSRSRSEQQNRRQLERSLIRYTQDLTIDLYWYLIVFDSCTLFF